jgi:hypothetical protein
MWIDETALEDISDTESTNGWPYLYSTTPIQALPGIKTVFRLPLREQTFATLPVTNDTTLCGRAQPLEVQLPIVNDGEPIHLLVDSTA